MKTMDAFKGIKVADFSWTVVGPTVGRELAMHGATVVRVESHTRPDTIRLATPFKDGIAGIDRSVLYCISNTNKLGMSLDLSKPKGQEVARRLVRWADIVTDSYQPGTMKKWGLDYESTRKIKPDIIYFSSCLQGQDGPEAMHVGFGTQAAGLAGFNEATGWPGQPPMHVFGAYTDYIAPFYLICAVIAALDYRRRTGEGLYIDQSQTEAGITFMASAILDYTANGRNVARVGNRDPYMAPHGAYRCKGEDRWCVIVVRSDKEWEAFCRVVGQPKWTEEAKFATLISRKENEDELDELIEQWTKQHTSEEVMLTMQGEGIPAGVVQDGRDLFEDPQLRHRDHLRWLDHKVIGHMSYESPAYRLSRTPCRLVKAAPCLGEDNERVYKDILEYTDDEIADMLIEGVITTEYVGEWKTAL